APMCNRRGQEAVRAHPRETDGQGRTSGTRPERRQSRARKARSVSKVSYALPGGIPRMKSRATHRGNGSWHDVRGGSKAVTWCRVAGSPGEVCYRPGADIRLMSGVSTPTPPRSKVEQP